jgi:hypothetical protein
MVEVVGRYRLLRPIGEGGMGRVFVGEVIAGSGFVRQVVIKVVRDDFDEALKKALLDEARLVASLVHRNIVPVLDLQEIGTQRFVILEHVDGVDLRHLLDRVGRLSWPLAVFVAAEVAAGLDYAHRKVDTVGQPLSIVHRDVSPANVLLSWEGEVKLTDFGVAKFARTDESLGGLKGNIGYMPPEQARGDDVDARADVFALGVLLYEALAGQNPFRGRSALATLAHLRDGRVPRLSDGVVPAALADIVERATRRDRGQRFATAAELRQALVTLPDMPPDPAPLLAQLLASTRSVALIERDALLDDVLAGNRRLTRVGGAAAAAAAAGSTPRWLTWTAGALSLALALAVAVWFTLRRRPIEPVATTPPIDPVPLEETKAPEQAIRPPPDPPPTRSAVPQTHDHAAAAPRTRARGHATETRSGTLSINSIPWANLFIDGQSAGHTPRLNVALTAGRHQLQLVTTSGARRTRSVNIAAGKQVTLVVNFAEP